MCWTHDHTRCISPTDHNPHLTLTTNCHVADTDNAQYHTPQLMQAHTSTNAGTKSRTNGRISVQIPFPGAVMLLAP